ncbi:hypothetical protein AAES_51362 [Amazona aestiva]|uniref:Uncharacterized protein n=1 Tax=Amazona aestiva TaxID=12930 RepID=A0A0Q3MNM6_AMAAE|nr:hypothetical protein AAES_51362 [Amazona aestiva]
MVVLRAPAPRSLTKRVQKDPSRADALPELSYYRGHTPPSRAWTLEDHILSATVIYKTSAGQRNSRNSILHRLAQTYQLSTDTTKTAQDFIPTEASNLCVSVTQVEFLGEDANTYIEDGAINSYEVMYLAQGVKGYQ